MTVQTVKNWAGEVAKLKLRSKAFIDGRYVESASGQTFDCINPATGQVITAVAACDSEDVNRAVDVARRVFEAGTWSRMDPADRKRKMLAWASLMRDHADELALLETIDMGKPISDSLSVDVPAAINSIVWMAEAIDKLYDQIAPTGPGALSLITREPLGVVAAVVPWNFPLLMACWKLGPALAAGNSVILKPAEQSPLTAIRIAGLAVEAGMPAGVFNVVPGFGETAGKAIGLHHDIDAVAFTGSTQVGKLFLQYAGQSNMKRVSLECGGKTPHIIMKDCDDLDTAARAAAWGIFFNQGEVCNAGSRLLIDERIKDAFLEKLIAESAALMPNDPLDPSSKAGAMVTEEQMSRVLDYIQIGQKEGAKLRLGGKQVRQNSGGYFIEPTIFDNVSSKMRIAQEEIFGPVLSTISFRSEEEAIAIANDTVYGLAAAIWTHNIDTAIAASRRLRAGVVWVNCFDEGSITSPFGGFKQSGFGRDKSIHAIEKYTDLKTTWIKVRKS